MWLNVYVSYAVLTLCAAAAYGLFSKRIHRKGLTDGVGFEPTVRYERTHTFQACALNHSATRPNIVLRRVQSQNRASRRTQLRTANNCELRTAGLRAQFEGRTRRTGRDSNSRYRVHRYAGFRDRCLQPLGHLSCSLASYWGNGASSTRPALAA